MPRPICQRHSQCAGRKRTKMQPCARSAQQAWARQGCEWKWRGSGAAASPPCAASGETAAWSWRPWAACPVRRTTATAAHRRPRRAPTPPPPRTGWALGTGCPSHHPHSTYALAQRAHPKARPRLPHARPAGAMPRWTPPRPKPAPSAAPRWSALRLPAAHDQQMRALSCTAVLAHLPTCDDEPCAGRCWFKLRAAPQGRQLAGRPCLTPTARAPCLNNRIHNSAPLRPARSRCMRSAA